MSELRADELGVVWLSGEPPARIGAARPGGFEWSRLATATPAHVTLRGLRVDLARRRSAPCAGVIPWVLLARRGGGSDPFAAYTPEGFRVTIGSRTLQLRIRSARESRVAERLRRRAFDQSMRRGELSFLEFNRETPWKRRTGTLLLAVACIVMTGGLISFLNMIWSTVGTGRRLIAAVSVTVLLLGCLWFFRLLLRRVWRQARAPMPVSALVTSEGFSIDMSDGSVVTSSWTGIADVQRRVAELRVVLHDGVVLDVQGMPRFMQALRAFQRTSAEPPEFSTDRAWHGFKGRVLLYGLAGLLAVNGAVWVAQPPGVTLFKVAMLHVVASACILIMVVPVLCVRIGRGQADR